MSTRSGKRIHSSFHENTIKADKGTVPRSERKTRSKCLDANIDDNVVVTEKSRKRKNYVSYPANDDQEAVSDVDSVKPSRVLRRNAVKEQNVAVDNSEDGEVAHEPKILRRKSKRGRKLVENIPEEQQETENIPEDVQEEDNNENMCEDTQKPKTRKSKKKKEVNTEPIEDIPIKKAGKKKKKSRKTNSIEFKEIEQDDCILTKNTFIKSMSIDSFHSAAGSPKCSKDFDVKTNLISDEKDMLPAVFKLDNNIKNVETRMSSIRRNTAAKCKSSIMQILENNCNDTFSDINLTNETLGNEKTNKKSSILIDSSDDKRLSVTLTNKEIETQFNDTFDKELKKKDSTFDKSDSSLLTHDNTLSSESVIEKQKRKSNINNGTFGKEKVIDTTFEKSIDKKDSTYDKSTNKILDVSENDANCNKNKNNSIVHNTFEKIDDTTFEKDTTDTLESKRNSNIERRKLTSATYNNGLTNSGKKRKSLQRNSTIDKDELTVKEKRKSLQQNKSLVPHLDSTFDKDLSNANGISKSSLLSSDNSENSTIDKNELTVEEKRKSLQRNKSLTTNLDSTFDKDLSNANGISKSSLLSSDNSEIDKSNISRISITSDESMENIVNTTPVLIESSMDESRISKHESPVRTPLKREGTFTKESPEVSKPVGTPSKSMPTAGCTPYHANKSSQKKPMLNVTRSIEKACGNLDYMPRTTRVMFCSPVDNPALFTQEKRKIIKSNLKGSNKSFVFEDTAAPRPGRKRSHTHGEAEQALSKRSRLTEDLQLSVNRLSRPRTTSATAKFPDSTTPKVTPSKAKEAKQPRTKLPNFAALHQRRFDKMESLDECQLRKAKRARQLLTPTGAVTVLERSSPRGTSEPPNPKEQPKNEPTKQPTIEPVRPGFTRFGFKLNLDVNPFSIPPKTLEKPIEQPKQTTLTRQKTLPSLTGATVTRREVAKQTVMREKSFTDKRKVDRTENRTIIKGVRLNRRFELQMKLRNLD